MRSPGTAFALGFLGMLFRGEMLAQYRVALEPSIEINEVHDDNLFFSEERPAGDLILRVRPALALQLDSPRWSATGKYAFDSDRFANYSTLNNARARDQASIGVQYRSTPRLVLALDGAYVNTDTPTDLNIETGLAAFRVRAKQLTLRPAARFRISPRLSAHASYFSTSAELAGGTSTRAQFQTVGIEQRLSARDSLTVDYEQGLYVFNLDKAKNRTNTYLVLAGWKRDLGQRTRLMLQAGPRITDGSPAAELSASLAHQWRSTSIAISGQQTQTTVMGSIGTVEARNLQARFSYAPTRFLTAFAAPAVLRTVRGDLQATVYRIGVGARYTITPLMGIDAIYSFDSQRGAIDRLRANDNFSHGTLSVGLRARWSGRD